MKIVGLLLILCFISLNQLLFAPISNYQYGVVSKDAVKSAKYAVIGKVLENTDRLEGTIYEHRETLKGFWYVYNFSIEHTIKNSFFNKQIIKVKVFESTLHDSTGFIRSKYDLFDKLMESKRYLCFLNENFELVQPQGSILQLNDTIQLENDHVLENLLISSIADENYDYKMFSILGSIPNLDIDFGYKKLKDTLIELSNSKNDQISRLSIKARILTNDPKILDEKPSRIANNSEEMYIAQIANSLSSWSNISQKDKIKDLMKVDNSLIKRAVVAVLYKYASADDIVFFEKQLDNQDEEIFLYSVWSLSKIYNLTREYTPGRGLSLERKEDVRKLWKAKLKELR
jgi:hypothetical protein